MENVIWLSFLPAVVIIFSLFLVSDNALYHYKMTMCHDDSMLTHCVYSNYKEEFQVSDMKIIRQYFIFTCPMNDGFISQRTLEEFKKFKSECTIRNFTNTFRRVTRQSFYYIAIRASKIWQILNESNIQRDFYSQLRSVYSNNLVSISFIGFKGFDIESMIALDDNWMVVELRGRFDLYARGRLVNDCDDYLKFNTTTTRGFIFNSSINVLAFYRPDSKRSVCSLLFQHARISDFEIYYMINSFYLKNMLTFTDPSWLPNYDSHIIQLTFTNVYGLDVDSRLLNPYVFASIENLNIIGNLNSIATDVFKPFRDLQRITFDATYVLRVIRRQGIGWIKSINSHVNENLSSNTTFITGQDQVSTKCVVILVNGNRDIWSKKNLRFFLDEDFCLFVEYPFHQLAFILFAEFYQVRKETFFREFSCTEIWLYQFYYKLRDIKCNFDHLTKIPTNSNFSGCDFPRRIDLCQKTRFQVINSSDSIQTKLTPFDLIISFELAFIILASSISLFGIITNLMTILVILSKKNKETMREKHYLYLSAYCISNMIIFATQILTLMSECQYPFGFYCSSIRQMVVVQYIKVIFGEYLHSACRMFSNFAYFGFSVCRLAKIGKDHGKVIEAISDLKMKTFITISLGVSAGLAVCKALQNQIHIFRPFDDTQEYPLPIFQFNKTWANDKYYIALFIVNFVFNLINYFLFVCVHLFVDVVLIRKLVRVLREKEEKMREMKKSSQEMDELSKQNEESKRRAVFMVVLNSTLNLFTRAPLMITFLNDLRYLIQIKSTLIRNLFNFFDIEQFDTSFSFKYYCSSVKACLVFQSFGNSLVLLSLASILFFLKHFDNNFKKAYQDFFIANTTNNKKQ